MFVMSNIKASLRKKSKLTIGAPIKFNKLKNSFSSIKHSPWSVCLFFNFIFSTYIFIRIGATDKFVALLELPIRKRIESHDAHPAYTAVGIVYLIGNGI